MKRALVFSPYLDSIGGGEVYTLHFAKALEMAGYRVELAWHDERTLTSIHKFLGVKLENLIINREAYRHFRSRQPIWRIYSYTKEFDLIFFLSDGSIPFVFATKNILHFQVPFTTIKANILTKLKLQNQTVVCNSAFTQEIVNTRLKTQSQILYPPVKLRKAGKKIPVILSVGRFTDSLHNKRQDVLVEAFKNLFDEGFEDWKLVLVGNDREGKRLVNRIHKLIKNYPIQVLTEATHAQLNKLYASSSIYWHAAGFGIDETKYPERVEHFGMSTVEAMSAGCVPIVIRKGGQKEIVQHNRNGYLFDTKQQLISYTSQVIQDLDLTDRFRANAIKTSQQFSTQNFYQQVIALVEQQ